MSSITVDADPLFRFQEEAWHRNRPVLAAFLLSLLLHALAILLLPGLRTHPPEEKVIQVELQKPEQPEPKPVEQSKRPIKAPKAERAFQRQDLQPAPIAAPRPELARPAPRVEVQPNVEPTPQPRLEAKPGIAPPQPLARFEPRPEPRALPQARPEPRPEVRPEPRPEPRVEPRPEVRPEPRLEARAEPRPQLVPEPRPIQRIEPRPEPITAPHSEPKVEPRQEPVIASRPVLRPDTAAAAPRVAPPTPEPPVRPRPEARAEAQPAPQPLVRPEPKLEAAPELRAPVPQSVPVPAPEPRARPRPEARAEAQPAPQLPQPTARSEPKLEARAEAGPPVPQTTPVPAGPARPGLTAPPSQAVAAPPLPAAPRSSSVDEDAILKRYARDISRMIGKSVSEADYPRLARQKGWEGTPEVRLVIGADGHLKNVLIASGSGYEVLDERAVEMVKRVRLPRIPSVFRARQFSITVPIAFILRKQ